MPQSPSLGSLADGLFSIGAMRFGSFTLASGKASSYYLDLRMIPSFPDMYSMVTDAYVSLMEGLGAGNYDGIAGVATAGLVLSSPLAFVLKKPMVYVRKEEKGHGLGKQVEGAVSPGWRAVVVDDVITTGGSLVSAIEILRKAGCVVSDAALLVDREEGGKSNLAQAGVKLHAFAQVSELVEVLYEEKKMTKAAYEAVGRQIGGG